MTIETTVFTFKLSNTFEEWVKMFDSPEIDTFHKNGRPFSFISWQKFN